MTIGAKSLLAFLGSAFLASAPARAAEVKDTKVFCVVFAFGKDPKDVKRYFSQTVTLPEHRKLNDDNTVEIFRSEHAIYQAYISQYFVWPDKLPQHSALLLTIRDAKTGKQIAQGNAFWPMTPADGRLEGLTRLEVRTQLAEPEYEEVTFYCDSRLQEETKE